MFIFISDKPMYAGARLQEGAVVATSTSKQAGKLMLVLLNLMDMNHQPEQPKENFISD